MVSALIGGICSCGDQEDPAEENRSLTQRAEKLWNTGDLTIADSIYASDFVNHDPSAPEVTDLSSYKAFIADVRSGMPDFHVTIEDMVVEGDKMVSRWTASGTHQDEFSGIPPTGREATWTGITMYRMDDGKVVEAWWFKDVLGMLQQFEVIPPVADGPPFMNRKSGDCQWGEPSTATGEPGDPAANKALYMREVNEVWNQGNLEVLDEVLSTHYVNHNPYYGMCDREVYKQWVAPQLDEAPRLIVDDIIAEGDRVASRWTYYFTPPDSDKEVTCPGIDICRFVDGKIAERWWSMDMMGVLQQTGAMPPPGEQG